MFQTNKKLNQTNLLIL